MAKPKPTDEQKRAKNIKQAKINTWLGLVFFTVALFMLCVEVRFWQSEPTSSLALDLLFTCGLVLAASFMRADAKETLRRGGEKYESFGGQIGILLAITCHFFKETSLPLSFAPWFVGLYAALTLGAFAWLTFRMKQMRRTRNDAVLAGKAQ